MDAKQLAEQATALFSKRSTLVMMWQEVAENFYPERADFTVHRVVGTDFASGLMTSYPILARRDLGDQFGSMLRPTNKEWFHTTLSDVKRETLEAKRWLQMADQTMRKAMYDPIAHFNRALKEGDMDFASFGQCVITVELNSFGNALLYRCWHLRDVVWQENANGKICFIARKWKPGARDLLRTFPKAEFDKKIIDIAKKEPFKEVNVMHFLCEADMYDDKAGGKLYWSIYYDVDNDKVIEKTPLWNQMYVIPRWQTVSGSQYAYSPATVAALPEARLLQAMTLTLLEAGEKAVNPPMIATINVVKSDMDIAAGGVTWVDEEYDEKMGEALRPLTQDLRGMPLSQEMRADTRAILSQAFYLNKLTIPQRGPEMTAYEVSQRVQEYIRGALPLFEPMESNYNGQICEVTFDLLRRNFAFGSEYDMPVELRGANIDFQFESPLHDAIKSQKGHKFTEMSQLIAQAVALDPTAQAVPKTPQALRDALDGIGVEANWINSEIEVEKKAQEMAAQQAAQQMLASMQQGSEIAKNLGEAQQSQVPAV